MFDEVGDQGLFYMSPLVRIYFDDYPQFRPLVVMQLKILDISTNRRILKIPV